MVNEEIFMNWVYFNLVRNKCVVVIGDLLNIEIIIIEVLELFELIDLFRILWWRRNWVGGVRNLIIGSRVFRRRNWVGGVRNFIIGGLRWRLRINRVWLFGNLIVVGFRVSRRNRRKNRRL